MSIFNTEDRQPDEFAERAYSYRAWSLLDQAGTNARYDELRACVLAEINELRANIDTLEADRDKFTASFHEMNLQLLRITPVYEAAMAWHASTEASNLNEMQPAEEALYAACEAVKKGERDGQPN